MDCWTSLNLALRDQEDETRRNGESVLQAPSSDMDVALLIASRARMTTEKRSSQAPCPRLQGPVAVHILPALQAQSIPMKSVCLGKSVLETERLPKHARIVRPPSFSQVSPVVQERRRR
ncbi:uncharacterized protein RCC_10387 [Ramularia collo-cygni]|uniref:Uncharacterized protein n=1 Tax=Ramularia collo-cygni TaxID=112498 RepID=A0A2D3VJR3_9PEZI|nr:uncharacterized protein RCC_10387 [Ramularia collo-cygni]CZT24661.1 uncharacterized protein RCC_10387 [Ramularia collo-cygni]